jgi:hypothetical protein
MTTIQFRTKQELVSAKFGTPLFCKYDHDGLLLDLFGLCDGDTYDVMEVAITGTRFSVLKLCPAELIEDMNLWCERQHEKEEDNVEADLRDKQYMQSRAWLSDFEGRN